VGKSLLIETPNAVSLLGSWQQFQLACVFVTSAASSKPSANAVHSLATSNSNSPEDCTTMLALHARALGLQARCSQVSTHITAQRPLLCRQAPHHSCLVAPLQRRRPEGGSSTAVGFFKLGGQTSQSGGETWRGRRSMAEHSEVSARP
jgi:hypothetical protein